MAGELKKLEYDVDVLRAQAGAIAQVATSLTQGKDNLAKQLETLKGDWQSDASTKFFTGYDTSWMDQIDRYVEMLMQLADALSAAADAYEPLEEEFNRITLDV